MIVSLLKLADHYGSSVVVYFGVALASALVEWGTFALAVWFMSPIPAACVGFVTGTGANLFLSRRYAFRSVRNSSSEIALVMFISTTVFLLNLAVFYLLYAFFLVPILVA